MNMKFEQPDFCDGDLELRCVNDEICIYATEKGLEEIIKFCEKLREHPNTGHIHLEDYNILTKKSLHGVIAIFNKSGPGETPVE